MSGRDSQPTVFTSKQQLSRAIGDIEFVRCNLHHKSREFRTLSEVIATLRALPDETEVRRWIRPSVGTASMYAGEHKLAVTTEWCRGWNACLDALDATGCQVDQGSPWPPINQCTDCNGAGQICTGNSGTEADGYAPILERCEVCDGTGRLGPAQKATDRIPGWCNTCTKPKHECACHK
jgi:hypothetical protein